MLARFLHPRTPIGLDIGSSTVKAVQFSGGSRRRKVAACTRFPRTRPDAPITVEELAEVRDVLGRQGFVGAEVVVAATAEKLLSGAIELPARAPGLPMEQIARAEFSRIHKCDVAAAEFGWWELPAPARGNKGTHVMAVAYPHASAEQQLSLFDAAGLHVRGLDTQAWALGRAALAAAGTVRTLAALDLGWTNATLLLVRDGVAAYERRMPTGGIAKLHAAIGARHHLDPETIERLSQEVGLSGETTTPDAAEIRAAVTAHFDAIVAEVRKACGYAQHQYPDAPVGLLVLAGGGACVTGGHEYFAAALRFEVRSAGAGFAADSSAATNHRLTPSHASAAGLATFWN
jgi:Tfp pilus assembly PilM family ATPase